MRWEDGVAVLIAVIAFLLLIAVVAAAIGGLWFDGAGS